MKGKHYSRYKIFCLLAFIMCMPFSAMATPLTMEYAVTDLGTGLYQYDFELILDNHDGTWVSGNEWDWIIFGDVPYDDRPSPIADFSNFVATDLPTGSFLTGSSGGHNGPTLAIGDNSVSLPGWTPTAIGESLLWSGTSATFLDQSELLWSSLITGGGAQYVSFEVANLVSYTAPAPTVLGLMSIGLLGVSAATRRRNKMH